MSLSYYIFYFFFFLNCVTNFLLLSNLARGADMTIESDSGYSPMALAVALGHKKSRYTMHIFFFEKLR